LCEGGVGGGGASPGPNAGFRNVPEGIVIGPFTTEKLFAHFVKEHKTLERKRGEGFSAPAKWTPAKGTW